MEYNTQKEKLINGEYGRHIQKMIAYCAGIKNRDLRNEQAKSIIHTMAMLNPGPKDTEDFWHNLWDQLFIISNFQLDVDSPFERPDKETVQKRPQIIPYPKHQITFRPYGHLMESIIKKVAEEEGDAKEIVVNNIAKHLKKQYLTWNRDSVSDELILEHLDTLSNGKLHLSGDFQLPSTQSILKDANEKNISNTKSNKSKKKKKKKSNKQQNNPQNQQFNTK
ncbi:MAG: DUF4290 domain-containing protein [Bacteroidales bacterium]|nr:DUF4290 domain-containing protein [Bacteroidales bacterium]